VLAGQILTEDGTPVEKALVRLRLLDEPWESANVDMVQTTGRDGSYRFDGLTEKAAFQVFAYAKGYRTTDWVGAICGTRTDLMLEKGAVLRLLFVDGQGSPVPFAAVTVAGSALWPARSAMADEQGVLRLPGLSPGFYAFEATSAGQGFSLLEPIELAAGDHSLVLEYFQGPRYEIALQVFVTPPGGTEGIFSVRQ